MTTPGTNSARIATMQLEHIDDVSAIESAASPTPWTASMFVEAVERTESGCGFVALDGDNTLLGFAVLLVQVDEGHLMNIAVRPDQRRRGVAMCLVNCIVAEAQSRGCTAVTLEVRASNVAAQRLYHRFGFAPAGIRPKYYGDEDAVIMWTPELGDPTYQARLDQLRAASTVGMPS
jgi:[ribosomal protein S18]-alanine N-acetyltransferase